MSMLIQCYSLWYIQYYDLLRYNIWCFMKYTPSVLKWPQISYKHILITFQRGRECKEEKIHTQIKQRWYICILQNCCIVMLQSNKCSYAYDRNQSVRSRYTTFLQLFLRNTNFFFFVISFITYFIIFVVVLFFFLFNSLFFFLLSYIVNW